MLLGLYRATVIACSADGSTYDVQPEDARIPAAKQVPVRVGIPGAVAVIQPSAVVLLGWEKGDPSKPYCVPSYEAGATVLTLTLNANMVNLGGTGGEAFVKKSEFNNHVHTGPSTVCANGGAWTGSTAAPTTPAVGTSKVTGV